MGAFLCCLFFRNSATTFRESDSAADGLCGQDERGHDVDAQIFDCAFISGVCQDQVDKTMIAFTRDQYPREVIFVRRSSIVDNNHNHPKSRRKAGR